MAQVKLLIVAEGVPQAIQQLTQVTQVATKASQVGQRSLTQIASAATVTHRNFAALNVVLGQASSLFSAMGAGGIGVAVAQMQGLSAAASSLIPKLARISAGGLGLIGLGVAGAGFAGKKVLDAINATKAENQARGELAQTNTDLVESLREELQAREESRRLTQEEANDFRFRLQNLQNLVGFYERLQDSVGQINVSEGLRALVTDVLGRSGPDIDPAVRDALRSLEIAQKEAALRIQVANQEREMSRAANMQDPTQAMDIRIAALEKTLRVERDLYNAQLKIFEAQKEEAFSSEDKIKIEAEIVATKARLEALEEEHQAKLNAIIGAAHGERTRKQQDTDRQRVEALEKELALLEQANRLRLIGIDNNFRLTQAEKFRFKKNELLAAQAEGVPGATEGLAGLGPDPNSFGETWTAKLTELQDRVGTLSQIIARGFDTVVMGSIDSVANGIHGLLNLTMTWGQALQNIGVGIFNSIIQAIARMAAEFIVKQVLIRGAMMATHALGLVLQAKSMAIQAANAVVAFAKWLPSAIAAGISSYGTAAIIGTAAVLGVLGAYAAGAFKEGGFTGNAPTDQAVGVVHGQEFVFSAPAVRRIGVENLEAIHQGEAPRGKRGRASGAAAQYFNVEDRRAAIRAWMRSPEAEGYIMEVVGRNVHQLRK